MDRQKRIKAELLAEMKKGGVSLVGVASAERMAGGPAGRRPTDIMPSAKTVVVLARSFPAGPMTHGHWTSYTCVHDGNMARLDNDAYQLARYLEENWDGEALPVPAMTPYFCWDETRQYAAGDLSHKHAAAAAGLGVMGKNSLLITPQYGNRVNLVSVITNLKIEPDPVITDELCPTGCRLCIEACPTKAIHAGRSVDQGACRSHCWTKLDRGFPVLRCWRCRQVCPAGR